MGGGGVFDHFSRKKDGEIKPDQHQEDEVIHGGVYELPVEEESRQDGENGEKKKQGFLEKLHRSNSSSSSSSDEEEAGEEKEKKKRDKTKGEKKEETSSGTEQEDKKGIFEKIKEKLPGAGHDDEHEHRKNEDPHHYSTQPDEEPVVRAAGFDEEETKEKKGILEKIKEKLPGYNPNPKNVSEEDKEKETYNSS
ncbi:hypothetical protein NBC11_24740 [Salmonella sp. NW1098]|uniref:hypothetical protein n=1 Tax=Salmonella sp. NW1098 TaxID=2947535 RepID=UPI003F469042